MSLKIYIAHHKPSLYPIGQYFQPIHVGRSLASEEIAKRMDYAIGDDTGDNISTKNPLFNELTALYWLWKNSTEEHVGLMHYGRILNFSSSNLSYKKSQYLDFSHQTMTENTWGDEEMKRVICSHDIVVPEKWRMAKQHIITDHQRYKNTLSPVEDLEAAPKILNMYHHFALAHSQELFDGVLSILKSDYPAMYHQAWDSMGQTYAHFCNMFVMKRKYVDEYCAMLFDILNKLEDIVDFTSDFYTAQGAYNRAYNGFISERIFSIYLDLKRKEIDSNRWLDCSVSFIKPS